MSEDRRRLAAIMFTDIVGYTSISQRDEKLALGLLEKHNQLLRPIFAKHGGKEVKTIGDSFLVEFESALAALECAIDIQRGLHEQSDREKILVRVGIHVGDVVHRQGDVFGDAVNVASRIYPLAGGGEICISGQIYDQVRNKVPFRFLKQEPVGLKNVSTSIDVYKVELPWEEIRADSAKKNTLPAERIAVLPFVNISPDPNDEFFADGLTEELITGLSLVKGLKVIARTSAMNYKKKEKNVSQIGAELGVGTIVEGSVRKAGNRIRVTVQVIDVNTEEHLFASNYDASLDDVFAVQSDIAGKVAGSVPGAISKLKAVSGFEKDTNDVGAYMDFLQGRELLNGKVEEPFRQSIQFFQQAMEKDPQFSRAYVGMAQAYSSLGLSGFIPWRESIDTAKSYLSRALMINNKLAEAHSLLSRLAYMGDEPFEVMESEARQAIAINPNNAEAYQELAEVMPLLGRTEDWVRYLETGYQLDPLSPRLIERLSAAYMYTGRESKALELLNRTKNLQPLNAHRWLAFYYMAKGNLAEAEKEVSALEDLEPSWEFTLLSRGLLAAQKGDKQTAMAIITSLGEAHKRGWARSSIAGFIYYALGDADTFFEVMQRAAEDHTLRATDLMYSPMFAKAREDPRMEQALRTTGIRWMKPKS